jgi:O-acetyl-ADP-ribose deacetylase
MIKLVHGDITKISVDAIVNAANTSLLGGGGVDGAIHRAGGRAILEECMKIGGCEVGKAVITTAGKLPAKYVIHAVGPIWYGGDNNEEKLLANAYLSCLEIATNKKIKSISFPNISTGVYRFPKEKAAKVAINTLLEYFNNERNAIDVYFVCFDDENFDIYKSLLRK